MSTTRTRRARALTLSSRSSRSARWCRWSWLVGLAAPALAGCPSPNIYGTPRTLAPGAITHTFAFEANHYSGQYPAASGTGTTSRLEPSIPVTYMLRAGVAEQIDLGVRIGDLSSLGLDVKGNFLRSKVIDLAVDPGAQMLPLLGDRGHAMVHAQVPLLVGINFSRAASLVVSPGIAYVAPFDAVSTESDRVRILGEAGLRGRLGLGVNMRFSNFFALQPEVTTIRSFDSTKATIVAIGLGFSLGQLPSFDDVPEDDDVE